MTSVSSSMARTLRRSMFKKKFWIDALERAIKTFAQFLLAAGALDPMSADLQTSMETKLLGALAAAGVSILTSLVSTSFGQGDSASVVDTKGDDGAVDNLLIIVAVVFFILGAICVKLFGGP